MLPAGSIVVSGHEHLFCIRRGMGWTQIVASTGGGKRYDCRNDLGPISVCERLPEYPTYIRLDPGEDRLEQVIVAPEGATVREWSILAGPEE